MPCEEEYDHTGDEDEGEEDDSEDGEAEVVEADAHAEHDHAHGGMQIGDIADVAGQSTSQTRPLK